MTLAASTARDSGGRPATARLALRTPTAADLVALQAFHDQPAVSVLCSTTPGAALLPADVARLRGLVATAVSRVGGERGPEPARQLGRRLERMVDDAASRPARQALALFVSEHHASAWALAVDVVERVVVDPTFATRDLVRSLHRTPRHVVLVLSTREARLFDGAGTTLTPAAHSQFPMLAADAGRRSVRGGPSGPDRAGSRSGSDPGPSSTSGSRGTGSVPGGSEEFFRRVDRALRAYRTFRPAPLVLVGAARTLSAFRAVSGSLDRLAGTVHGSLVTANLPVLADRVRPVVERYLRSRQEESLALLHERADRGRVVDGMPAVWLAARAERPEMLAVEEGLFYPARVSADGDHLDPADDVEHPDVIDDVVDEVIEIVLRRGGWVALLEDGALADHDRVALAVHPSGRRRS